MTLADGTKVRLRFGFWGLAALEDEFGSLSAVGEAISRNTEGKQFGPIGRVLRCGLVHEGVPQDDTFLDLLDLQRLDEYAEAVQAAWVQAFPPPEVDTDKPGSNRPPRKAGTTSGRGTSGTTSRPSRSAAPMKPSGA